MENNHNIAIYNVALVSDAVSWGQTISAMSVNDEIELKSFIYFSFEFINILTPIK